MSSRSIEIADELRELILRGCTVLELARLADDHSKGLTLDEVIHSIWEVFHVDASYLRSMPLQNHPLDASILNASLLTEIVANRDRWQSDAGREECWIDRLYIDVPTRQSDEPPFELSPDTWESLADADRRRLQIACRTQRVLSYRCAVLAVLSEQLQMLYNERV